MKRALAFGFVLAQFLLLIALVLLPHRSLWPVSAFVVAAALVMAVVGAVLILMGIVQLGPALKASPIPRENAPLVTQGVYGVVRNPIYSGLLLACLGLTLVGSSIPHILIWIALAALLAVKTRWEERMLVAAHPEYRHYAARVGRFVPGLGRLRRPGT